METQQKKSYLEIFLSGPKLQKVYSLLENKPSVIKNKCMLCNNLDTNFFTYYKIQQVKQVNEQNFCITPIIYNKIKKEFFLCLYCSTNTVFCCGCCGDNFDVSSTVTAYTDINLNNEIIVCTTCYNYEACTQCRYLGGASPCRFCRSF